MTHAADGTGLSDGMGRADTSPGRDRLVPLQRLKKRAQFVAVAREGRKAAQPGLVLQARGHAATVGKADAGPFIGIGFTASRKVGKAVDRNRARRRLRSLAASTLPRHAKPGYDLVLIARQATVTRPYADLQTDLMRALRRLGLLRGPAKPAESQEGVPR